MIGREILSTGALAPGSFVCQEAIDVCAHLFKKLIAPKLRRMSSNFLRVYLHRCQATYCCRNSLGTLFGEEDAGNPLRDGFNRAAFPESDYRASACHRFHWDH